MKPQNLNILKHRIAALFELDMNLPSLTEQLQLWVNPSGTTAYKVAGKDENFHVLYVMAHPDVFGISPAEVQKAKDNFDTANPKRAGVSFNYVDSIHTDKLVMDVMQKGWLRVMFYGGEWRVSVFKLTDKTRKTIETFAVNLSTDKYHLPRWTTNSDLYMLITAIEGTESPIEIDVGKVVRGALEETLKVRGEKL